MKRIQIDSVQPGDILFTARPGKISKTIRFATGGVVSHAMICVQHSSFIDSTSDGVPSLRLCDDCIGIRSGMGNALVPFLSRPTKRDGE